ncbi:hypothetical protein EV2_005205 [Malus domestica]
MTAEVLAQPNGAVANGDLNGIPNNNAAAAAKKSRESERRRRRRKQKKNNKASQAPESSAGETDDDVKENNDTQQIIEQVQIEYVPEKPELIDGMDEEFRKIFEKFSFQDSEGVEVKRHLV